MGSISSSVLQPNLLGSKTLSQCVLSGRWVGNVISLTFSCSRGVSFLQISGEKGVWACLPWGSFCAMPVGQPGKCACHCHAHPAAQHYPGSQDPMLGPCTSTSEAGLGETSLQEAGEQQIISGQEMGYRTFWRVMRIFCLLWKEWTCGIFSFC